ncbi:hypothetical protein L249_3163 [Ophiocordyceps polyrhachis-furcata BCC 54312]|uniref:Pentacotripeptide-repeat region of PRORP domain-containing protein n=1 Tax=Ophiocordyceps polyrhachis-furcata BCC 54312 TaxID=1330021 RepID=A0A367LPJ3_9HYPO|nr:hypothetical protein L249_3163 [Ophiocordyceps polyrhachis-furcata BCC 54312]
MRIHSRLDSRALLSAGRRNTHVVASPARPRACPQSSVWLRSTFLSPSLPGQFRRRRLRSCRSSASRSPPKPIDRQYLLSLVGGEYDESVDQLFDFYRDPYRRGYALPDGPKVRVSDKKSDVQYPSHGETARGDENEWRLVLQLYVAIGQRLRNPNRISLDSIYKIYRRLSEPRMLLLSWHWRSRLMRVMGTPQRRNIESMLRYFALVADVKNAGLTLRLSEWNYALSLSARYTIRSTYREVESTLRLWREMEREAHVRGNEVTFNILFDVASKAGNFTLADMVYREMESRGIEFNRFHHVSLIHFFGLKLDSAGIRAAYREMVESGQMIDTVVLNCVISGLLRCGEEAAADEVYERMKGNHTLAAELPSRNYMLNRVISKVLLMFSKVSRRYPELKNPLQARVHLSPDLRTYKMLVRHHAIRLGNINKVAQYLDEMKGLVIPVHPTIFLALFKGFYLYGGFPGSDWSQTRLDGVLLALYQARDTHANDFPIYGWLVIWVLRAVKRCSSTEAVAEAFDELNRRWDVPADRQAVMFQIYDSIRTGRDLTAPWRMKNGMAHGRGIRDGAWL